MVKTQRWLCALALVCTACAHRYRGDGMVLRVDASKPSILLSHRDIPGYMPAMTMEFAVRNPRLLSGLQPGTRVRFDLAVGKRQSHISRIELRQSTGSEAAFTASRPTPLARGSLAPDFTLIDQTGKQIRLSDFRGRVVAIDFLYTRCPLPDVCPRLAANFARLQRRFGPRVILLSITIDPQNDTPEVLAQYAKLWKANPESWHFLTGDPEAIRSVASAFGMLYFADEGSMTHTSATAVIGRDGKVAGIVEGSAYAVSQLGDLIALEMEAL